MSIENRFMEYAQAFEATFEDDDWSRLEPFFTEDAVYRAPPDEDAHGRDAVIAKLKGSVESLDRRMDGREAALQMPLIDGDTLRVHWQVSYSKAGCPDLVISGVETAEFEGDRIRVLEDKFDSEAEARFGEWMAAYGGGL